MTTRLITILITLLISVTTFYGQTNYEPLDLANKIFAKEKFRNIENYVTGEYEGIPNGTDLNDGTTTKFTLLGQTEKSAVVNMTILDVDGKGIDTYLHFEKDKIWKVSAFRSLAMTGIIELAVIELEKINLQQIDTLFSSKAEYDFQLGNAKLILELDDNIIEHFQTNQTEFERLKNLALTQLEKEKIAEERSVKLIEDLKTEYKKIFISDISIGGYELGNCINFLIGGMIDNTVGYIFVKDKKDLPEMHPNSIIMIREIGSGWYLYKTT